jgi:hypothetical protein
MSDDLEKIKPFDMIVIECPNCHGENTIDISEWTVDAAGCYATTCYHCKAGVRFNRDATIRPPVTNVLEEDEKVE